MKNSIVLGLVTLVATMAVSSRSDAEDVTSIGAGAAQQSSTNDASNLFTHNNWHLEKTGEYLH